MFVPSFRQGGLRHSSLARTLVAELALRFYTWRARSFRGLNLFVLSGLVLAIATEASAQTDGQVRTYQDMLIWTQDYDGIIDGKLGEGTSQAIKDFQTRNGYDSTGKLTDAEVALLVQQGTSKKQEVGFKLYRDVDVGVAVGIPSKLLASPTKSKWGTSWAAINDRVNVDTLRVSQVSLRDLFSRLSSFRHRRVKYSTLKDTWFVVTGLDVDDAVVYVRATLDPATDDILGFSARITKDWREQLGHVPVAMSSSFFLLGQTPVADVGKPIPPPRDMHPNLPPVFQQRPTASDLTPCFNGLGDCPLAFTDK
jgi:Putative peptidoglycan binding domain